MLHCQAQAFSSHGHNLNAPEKNDLICRVHTVEAGEKNKVLETAQNVVVVVQVKND
jgi:hypothetical protein